MKASHCSRRARAPRQRAACSTRVDSERSRAESTRSRGAARHLCTPLGTRGDDVAFTSRTPESCKRAQAGYARHRHPWPRQSVNVDPRGTRSPAFGANGPSACSAFRIAESRGARGHDPRSSHTHASRANRVQYVRDSCCAEGAPPHGVARKHKGKSPSGGREAPLGSTASHAARAA